MIPAIYSFCAKFSLSNFWNPDYLQNWDQHVTTFWVPAAVGLVFVIMLIHSIAKKKIFLAVLYLILAGACITFIATGHSEVLNAVEGLTQTKP